MGGPYVSLRWALIARAAAIVALLLGLLAGLLPVAWAGGAVIVMLTLVATVALFTAAAAVLIGMRRPVPPEHLTARRSAMTVAILTAVVALPMIYLANQRVIEHLRTQEPVTAPPRPD